MANWIQKLDGDLQAWLDQPLGPGASAECLIRIDDARRTDVDQIIVDLGGRVRHRIHLVPGLVATLPRRAIEPVAASRHVLSIEAEQTYRIG